MKRILILLLLLISGLSSSAQWALHWAHPSPDYAKFGSMIACDTSNNLLVAGYRPAFMGAAHMYLRKYDYQGNFLWERTDSAGLPSTYEKARWVNTDNNNNVYMVGYRYSGTSNDYVDQIIAVKYDAAGNYQWRAVVPNTFNSAINVRSEVDASGNLYIGTIGVVPQGFRLIKLDTNGNILFDNAHAGLVNTGFSGMRLKDDKIVMTGGSVNIPTSAICLWDTSGNVLFGNNYNSRGGIDVEMSDSCIYLLSGGSNVVSASSGFDISLLKIDFSGNLISQTNYDFGGNEFGTRMTLVNNKISIIGYGIPLGSGYMDWITFQTDLNGIKAWDARYDQTTFNDEKPSWITATLSGDVFVSGQGGPPPGGGMSSYLSYVVLKYSNGAIQWIDTNTYNGYIGIVNVLANDSSLFVLGESAMTAIHYRDPSTTSITENNSNGSPVNLSLSPNPTSTDLNVTFTLLNAEKISVELNDIAGRKVMYLSPSEFEKGTHRITVATNSVPSGVYLITLKSAGWSKTLKAVICKE